MNATTVSRAILLFFALAFVSMMGFSQTDDRKEQAKEVSTSLTGTMTEALNLTETQKDSVSQCNMSYALALYTADPLTDDDRKTFEATLDSCLKEILDEKQYQLWTENQKDWLDYVKKNLPVKLKDEPEKFEDIDIF